MPAIQTDLEQASKQFRENCGKRGFVRSSQRRTGGCRGSRTEAAHAAVSDWADRPRRSRQAPGLVSPHVTDAGKGGSEQSGDRETVCGPDGVCKRPGLFPCEVAAK